MPVDRSRASKPWRGRWKSLDDFGYRSNSGMFLLSATGRTFQVVASDGRKLKGNVRAGTLIGGSGNDTLDRGAARDSMLGVKGDDTFYVSPQVDWVLEQPGEGTDTVNADSSKGH